MATKDFDVKFSGLEGLSVKAARFPDAARWALNRTIDSLYSKGSQYARQIYNINKADLEEHLDISYASGGNLVARIKGTKRPFGMARFAQGAPVPVSSRGFSQPKRGVKIKIKKGKQKIGYDTKTGQKVFWAWAKSGDKMTGHVALFSRSGPERDAPIRFAYALGAVDMFYTRENMRKLRDLAEQKLPVEFEKQIQSFFRRA